MATIKMTQGQLIKRLQSDPKRFMATIKKGALKAAELDMKLLKELTPIDLGKARDSWNIKIGDTSITINNDAPYAAVLDRGARPHNVSREGVENITQWAARKQPGLSEKELKSFVWAIIGKIKTEGFAGLFFIEKSMDERMAYIDQEVRQAFSEIK